VFAPQRQPALATNIAKRSPTQPTNLLAAAMPARWQPGYVFALRQQPGGGGLLAGACSDGAVGIWAAGPALQPLWGRRLHGAIAAGCAFTADGAALVSLSKAGEIVVLVRCPACEEISECGAMSFGMVWAFLQL